MDLGAAPYVAAMAATAWINRRHQFRGSPAIGPLNAPLARAEARGARREARGVAE